MSELQFDFHYGDESEQYTFYRIPKALFTNELLKVLSTDSKLLYGLMLDRMSLSRKNNWLDENKKVYIFFTHEDTQEFLDCASAKSTRLLGELESVGLIHRERQGQGRPTKIYVKRYVKAKIKTFEKRKSENAEPVENGENEAGIIGNASEYVENSEKIAGSEVQTFDNRKSRLSKTKTLDFPKSKGNNTNASNTEINNLSINLYDEDLMDRLTEDIKEQISYEMLCQTHPMEATVINEIVSILVEVASGTQETYSINSTPLPTSIVKKRLAELDHGHIEYVFECLGNTTTRIANIRAYLIASLYNAPQSIALYYQQRCRADGVV